MNLSGILLEVFLLSFQMTTILKYLLNKNSTSDIVAYFRTCKKSQILDSSGQNVQSDTALSVIHYDYQCWYILPTLPCCTSSLCAADAAFTRALVALAIALAASKICSSKLRLSSAC